MLLNKIDEEFGKLNEIIGEEGLTSLLGILREGKYIRSEDLLEWNHMIRVFTKSEALLEKERFETEIAGSYSRQYIMGVDNLFDCYDRLASIIKANQSVNAGIEIQPMVEDLYDSISNLSTVIEKINMANEITSEIAMNTWEPLPNDEKEDKVENIVILSETRSISLNDVASDIGNLDSFFKNVCQLINQDPNQSNNIYLRRVETGSLVVAVSCAMEIAPIIAFIYWCVKLYQKTEKRYLDNADKKLEVIGKSINTAKEILKIDPDNMEANEAIQRCAKHLLDFLDNNPTGTINGEHYDTGIEKLKIEDKEEKSN